MPTWAKVLIISGVILLLIALGVVGLGVYLWREHGRGFIETAQKTGNEGREYGRRTDAQGCLNEGLARHTRAQGFGEIVGANVFLRMCLDASRPTPGFCDSVPRQLEFIKSAEWQQEQCRKHGLMPAKQCGQVFAEVQKYCEVRRLTQK